MPFSIMFEYIPGSQNVVPDALSRYPAISANSCVTLVAPQLVGLVSRVAVAAKQDPEYSALVERLNKDADVAKETNSVGSKPLDSPALAEGEDYHLQDGVIFTKEGQILLPKEDELRTLVISEAHDSPLGGHFGQTKTLEKVRRW